MRNFRSIAVRAAMFAAILFPTVVVFAQLPAQDLLGDSFTGPVSNASVLTLNTGAPGFPCLTANPSGAPAGSTIPNCNLPSPDPAGQGALRFTSINEQQASAIVSATSLPTVQGLNITFTQHQYGGYGIGGPGVAGGADGISFFLAVAPPSPATLGPQGGALGYASAGGAAGLPGGWLGIGLDAFGNFSNQSFGGGSCAVPSWAGFTADAITVRGPGHGTNGYCLLSSSADPAAAGLSASLRGADRASSARTIQILIDPGAGTYTVNIDPAGGTNFELATSGQLPTSYYDPASGQVVNGIPSRIAFGFAASTGSATDIHEITSLTATTASGAVPELGLNKLNSLSAPPNPGDTFEYFIRPRVVGGSAPENAPLSIRVTDTLPTGVTLTGLPNGTSWTCTPVSAVEFTCAYGNPAPILAGTSLPQIRVPVILDAALALGTSIVNTATVISDDAAQPVNASNTVVLASGGPPLTVITTTLPDGALGILYNTALAASGGTGGYGWSLNGGSLPPGLAVLPAGAIEGTPSASGAFNFSVRVTDSSGAFTTRALSIDVPAPPSLVITTTSLPSGIVGTAYSSTLAATGGSGARTWSVATGALPGGLSLSAAGDITGTPTAGGTFAFTARVTDASGVDTQTLSILVTTPVAITTTTLPTGRVGTAYSATLAATGGTTPYSWTLRSGSLPAGLSLGATGLISGTPTTVQTATFVARATDANGGFAQRSFTIVISQLAITTTSLPTAQIPLAYVAQLQAAGGTGALRWTLDSGPLPPGLTLSLAGRISGVPTTPGIFLIFVRVTDAAGATAARGFNLRVLPAPLVITTMQIPPSEVGVPYSVTLSASGGTGAHAWSLASGALPAGLSLSPQGVLVGIPTVAGTSAFWVRVTDAAGRTRSQRLVLTIHPAVTITTTSLPGGNVGTQYSRTLARAGGLAPFTWTRIAGSLPPGLVLSTAGVIAGTPTVVGTFTFTVRVSDALNGVAQRALSIVVAGPRRHEKMYVVVESGSPLGNCARFYWLCTRVLRVVDVETNVAIKDIPLQGLAPRVTSSPDGSVVTVLLNSLQQMLIVNTDTDTVVGAVDLPVFGTEVAISPDNTRAYMTSWTGGGPLVHLTFLTVVNLLTQTIEATFPLGDGIADPRGIAVSSDGSRVFVAVSPTGNVPAGQIVVVNSATGAVVRRFPAPTAAHFTGIAATSDGTRLFATLNVNAAPNRVMVVNLVNSTAATLAVPNSYLVSLFVSTDDQRLYIEDRNQQNLRVYATSGMALLQTLPNTHYGLIPSPRGNFAYSVTFATTPDRVVRVNLSTGGSTTSVALAGGSAKDFALARGR